MCSAVVSEQNQNPPLAQELGRPEGSAAWPVVEAGSLSAVRRRWSGFVLARPFLQAMCSKARAAVPLVTERACGPSSCCSLAVSREEALRRKALAVERLLVVSSGFPNRHTMLRSNFNALLHCGHWNQLRADDLLAAVETPPFVV
jgi:hypothetical protein